MNQSFPQQALDALDALYDSDEIWLFGSHATGRARPDSDWDILVLLTGDAEKGRHSAVPGNEILEKAGLRGDVHYMQSDVFHASGPVANSLSRMIGNDRILLYRRAGYSPSVMTPAEAKERFVGTLKSEASEYLAAASVLSGKHFGRINLLRVAVRSVLVAMLTKADDHVGSDAYRTGGTMLMFERIPEKHRCDHLRDGIALLGTLNSFDLAEDTEAVPRHSGDEDAVLDRLQTAIDYLLREHL
ncbi:nucleotidyltransferase domain-containing protein [Agrobacterium rubi]|nr:nucleotidyltransferase domain-containing protein [Agrobacterium rubi]NTF24821.1 nucleotidyltransferase domain-containing protein [Agrobacterium rubi]